MSATHACPDGAAAPLRQPHHRRLQSLTRPSPNLASSLTSPRHRGSGRKTPSPSRQGHAMYTSPDQDPTSTTHQHGNSHQHGKSHHWMHLGLLGVFRTVLVLCFRLPSSGPGTRFRPRRECDTLGLSEDEYDCISARSTRQYRSSPCPSLGIPSGTLSHS